MIGKTDGFRIVTKIAAFSLAFSPAVWYNMGKFCEVNNE